MCSSIWITVVLRPADKAKAKQKMRGDGDDLTVSRENHGDGDEQHADREERRDYTKSKKTSPHPGMPVKPPWHAAL